MYRVGQKVVCVDAMPKGCVKNGLVYTVYSYEQSRGQDGKLYWYIGVEGNGVKTHNRIRPTIFAQMNFGESVIEQIEKEFDWITPEIGEKLTRQKNFENSKDISPV